jgi:hypothetical protein
VPLLRLHAQEAARRRGELMEPSDLPTQWEAVDLTTGEVIAIRHEHRTHLGAAIQLSGDHPEFFELDPSRRAIRKRGAR